MSEPQPNEMQHLDLFGCVPYRWCFELWNISSIIVFFSKTPFTFTKFPFQSLLPADLNRQDVFGRFNVLSTGRSGLLYRVKCKYCPDGLQPASKYRAHSLN